MEYVLFGLIFLAAVAILTQPLWRKLILKNEKTTTECESKSGCQTTDCTDCPLPTASHLQTYVKQKYGEQSPKK